MPEFPGRLREIRMWYGLSQAQLGSYLGMHQTTYSKRELLKPAGREPDLSELARLAYFLCVSTDWLLGMPGAPKWGTPVWRVREVLRVELPHFHTDPDEDFARLSWLLDVIARVIPNTLPAMEPGALLGCNTETLNNLRSGHLPVAGTQAAARLSEFAGVGELWLATGEYAPQDLLRAEWLPHVREAEGRGLLPQTLSECLDMLLTIQKRRQAKTPGT